MRTSFSVFRGLITTLVASAFSGAVIFYFYLVSWLGQAPDYNLVVGGQKIPPESYPILLLSLWTLAQRANAHWGIGTQSGRLGDFFWWEDLLEAGAVAVFIGITIFYTLKSGANMTFIIVLFAFFAQVLGDFIMNALHYFRPEEVVTGDVRIAPGAYVYGFSLVRHRPGYTTEWLFRDASGHHYVEDMNDQLVPLVPATGP